MANLNRQKEKKSATQGQSNCNYPVRGIERKMKRNEHNLTYLWDTIKCTNMHTVGVSKERKGRTVLKEILVENFPL